MRRLARRPPSDGGAAKLWVTSRALRQRRDAPELFVSYTPLEAQGSAADHALAFDRGGAVTVATRLPVGLADKGGWGDTTMTLPAGRWRDVLSGFETGAPSATTGGSPTTVRLADLLADLPVALLTRED